MTVPFWNQNHVNLVILKITAQVLKIAKQCVENSLLTHHAVLTLNSIKAVQTKSRQPAVTPVLQSPPNHARPDCAYILTYCTVEMQQHCKQQAVQHLANFYLNRVDKVLKNWGWHKIEDKTSTAFTLKWSELKQSIDYQMFREGRDNSMMAPFLYSCLFSLSR